MRKLLFFFLSLFLSFFAGGGGAGGGEGGHLLQFCVALADDSYKCYCYLLFKKFLLFIVRLRSQIDF